MNTPYSAKAQNPALKEFLSLDMSGAEVLIPVKVVQVFLFKVVQNPSFKTC